MVDERDGMTDLDEKLEDEVLAEEKPALLIDEVVQIAARAELHHNEERTKNKDTSCL